MAIEFAGFVYDDAGDAVVGATVNLYDRNTVTPVRATDTTDANGYWNISHATEGMFDIEIVNGTTKRRIKYDNGIQMEEIEVAILAMRNPANTFKYDVTPAAITADRILTLPLITAGETVAVLGAGGLAQAFAAVQSIGFPATQVPSADANTLDDYEEGTWTPGIAFGGGVVDITYTTQAGRYTKIGNQVHVYGSVVLSAKGTSTGQATITGLPFTIKNNANVYSAPVLHLVTVTFADYPEGAGNLNATTILLYEVTNAGTRTTITDADFANTSNVVLSFSYEV